MQSQFYFISLIFVWSASSGKLYAWSGRVAVLFDGTGSAHGHAESEINCNNC